MAQRQTTWLSRLAGCVFCLFWYFSIFSGFFILICPALPLAFFAPKLYRKWSDIVFGMWEPFPVAMMEILFNVQVTMSGDLIDPSEGSIFIMNHRTRLDWNFLWSAVFHSAHPHCHSLKFILKAPIMHIPGPGWVMQACSFLFIHRNWNQDQRLLANSLDYLKVTERNCQILIFPEGTDLTLKSMDKSHKFADKNGLNRYFRVLHPKTTGFVYLVKKMRENGQLDAIYDLTVGYPKTLPETELDMLRGKFPEQLHFNIKRYDISSVPKSEQDLKEWLGATWKAKEHILHRFYNHGSFTNEDFTPDCLEQNSTNELLKKSSEKFGSMGDTYDNDKVPFYGKSIPKYTDNGIRRYEPGNTLYLALIFWTSIVALFFYLQFTSFYFQLWFIFFTILFLTLSFASDGFHQILARYHMNGATNKHVD